MDRETSAAVVLRVKDLGESDLLVSFFARVHGRLRAVAKGARRSRRRFVNCLDVLCLAELQYSRRPGGKPGFLHSGRLLEPHARIRTDFERLSRASYMVELLEILFPWEVAEPEAFDLLRQSLQTLDAATSGAAITILYTFRIMALGGYAIRFDRCFRCGRIYRGVGPAIYHAEQGTVTCQACARPSPAHPALSPPAVKWIQSMQSSRWASLLPMTLPDELAAEIMPVLKRHREYHLGRIPKTAAYLE